ncbi:hypothetical protein BN2127_JRS10_00748 [Bacillus subtilis]|nr:hypothetical protein BN2127_JRS10_00748 [Bacillus subtilis]
MYKKIATLKKVGIKMKTIVFRWRYGMADHEVEEEEFEFDNDATEKEISEEWQRWIWSKVGEQFTWYEKENKSIIS